MSYCRFSCNDWASDVYVYATEHAFVTVVARFRYRFTEPVPQAVDPHDHVAAVNREVEVLRLLDGAERVQIDDSEAGQTYCDDSPRQCLERLEGLKQRGFRVPEHALDALQLEIRSTETSDARTGT